MQPLSHERRPSRSKRKDSVVSITSTCLSTDRQSEKSQCVDSNVFVRSSSRQEAFGNTSFSGILSKMRPSSRKVSLTSPSMRSGPLSSIARYRDQKGTPPYEAGENSTFISTWGTPFRTIYTPRTGRNDLTLSASPLPSTQTEADFYKKYSTFRQLMERARLISHGMRDKVNIIAQVEEEQRILSSLKHTYPLNRAPDSSSSFRNDPLERQKSTDCLAKASCSFFDLKDYLTNNQDHSGILSNQHDQHALLEEVKEKCKKLEKLRSYQRTILLSEEMQFGRHLDSTFFSEKAERHSAMKITSPGFADFAAGVQEAYEALEAANPDHAALVSEPPPSTFSLSALFITVGRLGQALEGLVGVTDEICVRGLFKTHEEVDLHAQVRRLHALLAHAEACFQVGMRYLVQFEAAERALLENGGAEVNTLREQFLAQKELLTAQEEREKAAEESRSGLQNRLQLLTQRCELWQGLLTASSAGPRPPAIGRETTASPPSSVGEPSRRVSPTASTDGHGGLPAERAREQKSGDAGLHCGSAGSGSDVSTPFGFSSTPHAAEVRWRDSSHLPCSAHSQATPEDIMERRLAFKWGNPHILKCVAYERAEGINSPEGMITTPTHPNLTANTNAERFLLSQGAVSEVPIKSNLCTPESSPGGLRAVLSGRPPFAVRPMNTTALNKSEDEGPRPSFGQKSEKSPVTRYTSTVSLRDANRRRSLRYRNISIAQTGGVEATMYARLLSLLRNLLRAVRISGGGGESISGTSDSQGKERITGLSASSENNSKDATVGELLGANNDVGIPEGDRMCELHCYNLQYESSRVHDSIHKLIKYLSEAQMPKRTVEA